MDSYTEKYFFEEIRDTLDARPIEKLNPFFLYQDEDGNIIALHSSGNKILTDDLSEVHYLLSKWMKEIEENDNGNRPIP